MPFHSSYSFFPLGDSALLVQWAEEMDEAINNSVLQLFKKLQQAGFDFITNLVPAYASLTVHYNSVAVAALKPFEQTCFEWVTTLVETVLEQNQNTATATKKLRIPVCYHPSLAYDLEALAASKKVSANELIALHTARSYRVYMLGFLPGFAYMGEVDARICFPRKATPRLQVPAGSVGIAGKQTGIYPLNSPGGWQIVGRTPVKIFDATKQAPVLLQPGDEVTFYSITINEFAHYQGRIA